MSARNTVPWLHLLQSVPRLAPRKTAPYSQVSYLKRLGYLVPLSSVGCGGLAVTLLGIER